MKGSSLAILDAADATETAPAVATAYRCTTCPQRDPLAFVVFPGSPLRQALREPGPVEEAWVTAEGGVVALVKEQAHGAPLSDGHYHVTLDADLRPVSVEVTNQFIDLLNWFHRAGRLDHPYSPAVDRQLLPVLHWRDGRFVEVGVADAVGAGHVRPISARLTGPAVGRGLQTPARLRRLVKRVRGSEDPRLHPEV